MVNINKIRSLAKLKNIKLGTIQEKLGVRKTYFAEVNAGKDKMSDDRIRIVADILGTTYEYLTDISDNPLPPSRRIPLFDYNHYNERRIARHLTPDYSEAQLHLPENYWEDVRDGFITPDKQTVTRLAVLLDTTYDYLMGLTDDPRIPSDERTGVKIRVFGDVAAGIPREQIDNFDPEDIDSWEEIDRPTAKNGTYFALRIKGDSMETRIKNGDRVIVRYQETVESGQTAIVAINGNTATCKRVIWDDQGGMILMPNNPAYIPQHFTAEEIQKKPVRILGLVVEIRGLP